MLTVGCSYPRECLRRGCSGQHSRLLSPLQESHAYPSPSCSGSLFLLLGSMVGKWAGTCRKPSPAGGLAKSISRPDWSPC